MYKLIDVRGWPVAIYFTLFVTAGMWGVTTLLVAVLSNAYEDMHAQAVYDEKQERIRRHRDKTLGPPPPKLGDRILEVCKRMHLGPLNEEGRKRRRHLRRIVVSRGFDIMVTVVVVANVAASIFAKASDGNPAARVAIKGIVKAPNPAAV